jgi:hypothetical protein
MPPVGFELAIPASERPQTHVLERTATGIGLFQESRSKFLSKLFQAPCIMVCISASQDLEN